MELNVWVTWRAPYLGFTQELTAGITAYYRPNFAYFCVKKIINMNYAFS
jgi:hypothetical protein